MKKCPLCQTVYADDTLNFCLNDGSELFADDSAPTVPDFQFPRDSAVRTESLNSKNESVETVINPVPLEKTVQSLPETAAKNYPPPITLPSSPRRKYQPASPLNDADSAENYPPDFKFETPNGGSDPRQKNSAKYLLFALPVLIAAVIGAWWFFARRGEPVANNDNQIANSSVNNNSAANIENKSTAVADVSPTATPKNTDEINLAGTWTGTSGVTPTTLIIEKGEGNNFSGTKVEGSWEAVFTGTIDPVSRQVVWTETKLLKGDSRTYSLGVNTGKISADGKKISGTGKDKFSKYPWSFIKR